MRIKRRKRRTGDKEITIEEVAVNKMITPVTPGELLKKEFLEPMSITKYRLAKEIGVPAQRIGDIVLGKRSITADTDLRLCKFFGLSDGYWLRVQANYDNAVIKSRIEKELDMIVPWSERVSA